MPSKANSYKIMYGHLYLTRVPEPKLLTSQLVSESLISESREHFDSLTPIKFF